MTKIDLDRRMREFDELSYEEERDRIRKLSEKMSKWAWDYVRRIEQAHKNAGNSRLPPFMVKDRDKYAA